ncbi:hypothetical protein QL093DRAFT_1320484 [Fusarium oxysporum]|nr:hypothetical protein QL093DRAFT_1320484 [Fusarium oxysporum]
MPRIYHGGPKNTAKGIIHPGLLTHNGQTQRRQNIQTHKTGSIDPIHIVYLFSTGLHISCIHGHQDQTSYRVSSPSFLLRRRRIIFILLAMPPIPPELLINLIPRRNIPPIMLLIKVPVMLLNLLLLLLRQLISLIPRNTLVRHFRLGRCILRRCVEGFTAACASLSVALCEAVDETPVAIFDLVLMQNAGGVEGTQGDARGETGGWAESS